MKHFMLALFLITLWAMDNHHSDYVDRELDEISDKLDDVLYELETFRD